MDVKSDSVAQHIAAFFTFPARKQLSVNNQISNYKTDRDR